MAVTNFLDGNGLRHLLTRLKGYLAEEYLGKTEASAEYATKAEDAAKLPLSGGTMTGTIMLSNNGSIRMSGSTGFTGLYSAASYVDGAYVSLNSKGYPSEGHNQAGAFFIYARNGNAVKGLVGKTDGSLQWDSKTIECAVEKGSGYLKFSDGTQICWGTGSSSTTPTAKNFPRAFKSAPALTMTQVATALNAQVIACRAHSVSGTSYTPMLVYDGTSYVNSYTYHFIAVGEGAD